MSGEIQRDTSSGSPISPQTLDMTGLPAGVADELRRLVAALQDTLIPASARSRPVPQEHPDQWAQRLQAWVDTHPARPIMIDDSRENLYAERGE